MSFDARHPDTPVHAYDPANVNPFLATAKLHPDLLHKVGEVFSVALSRVLARVTAAGAGTVDDPVAQAALAELARLERFGVQLQEISRVLAREGGWTTERINLTAAIRQTLAAWAGPAALAGAALTGPADDFEVEVNPPVLEQLLELGVEYALHVGDRITLGCGEEGEPPGPTLRFDIQRTTAPAPTAPNAGTETLDDLQWQLFYTLARAMGWLPRRQAVGSTTRLTVRLAEPATAVERSAALLPRTPVAVGRHILLLDPQDVSREEAVRLLREVGLQVDVTVSVDQARSHRQQARAPQPPDVLLTGLPADDPGCAALIDSLRAEQPKLRVVEIVDDDSAFTFSVPGTDAPARVGRHTLERTLVAAISQELDAA